MCVRAEAGEGRKGKQVRKTTYSGNVFRGEFVRRVRDEETRLSYSPVANDDTFDGLHGFGLRAGGGCGGVGGQAVVGDEEEDD